MFVFKATRKTVIIVGSGGVETMLHGLSGRRVNLWEMYVHETCACSDNGLWEKSGILMVKNFSSWKNGTIRWLIHHGSLF